MTGPTQWHFHARITRWIDDDPQPGIVECRFIDRFRQEWVFVDKVVAFTADDAVRAHGRYPQPALIACEVVSLGRDEFGRETAEIDTERPWGIESQEGVTRFQVFADQLTRQLMRGPE